MNSINLILSIISDSVLFVFILTCVNLFASKPASLRDKASVIGLLVFVAYDIFFRIFADKDYTLLSMLLYLVFFLLMVMIPFVIMKQSFVRSLYVSAFSVFAAAFLRSILLDLIYSFCSDVYYEAVNCAVTAILILITLAAQIPLSAENNYSRIKAALSLLPRSVYVLVLINIILLGALASLLSYRPSESYENIKNIILNIIMVILSLTSIVSIVIIILSSISKRYYSSINSVLKTQIDKQIEYYNKTRIISDDLRRFRHDYRNHMNCIKIMLKSNEVREAAQYIESLTEQSPAEKKQFITGNKIADAVLTDKEDNGSGTDIDFSGRIPENMDNVDLCVILSNALDNAIEACGKIEDESKRRVAVLADYRQGYFSLSVINSVSEDIDIARGGILPTTKGDPLRHGFGMSNIKRTVDKYDGRMDVECSNRKFRLNVIIKIS